MEAFKIEQPTVVSKTCQKHGDYESKIFPMGNRSIESPCPKCSEERDRTRRLVEQKESELVRIQNRLQVSGISKRHLNKSFSDFLPVSAEQVAVLDRLKNYAESFPEVLEEGKSLILHGTTGTGKTHLASSIVKRVIEQGYSAKIYKVRRMIKFIKSSWSKTSEYSEDDLINQLVNLDLLVIDEIGVQFDSEAENILLFDVIDGRNENLKPTIIISNLPIDAKEDCKSIKSVLGDRIIDRLREGGGTQIKFEWQSNRS